jgi:hypothetical protein
MNPVAKLLKETVITEIPYQFINHMEVTYTNGSTIHIDGDDVTDPVVIFNQDANNVKKSERLNTLFKNISNIKIYIDFDLVGKEIDSIIDEVFASEITAD